MSKVRLLVISLCSVMLLNIVSCGYIMYPERKGQKGGKIDAGVAVLDGIGLLFFIIPGIVAYAVDFSTGCIYLPGTSASSNDESKGLNVVKVDGEITSDKIEAVLKEQAQMNLDLDNTYILSEQAGSKDDLSSQVRWLQ